MHQPDHSGGAGHVALHIFHAGSRLDRHAAGIEHDALAHEGDRLAARLAAVPLHHREARRPGRALRDAEKRAHAELAHLLFGEDLDLDAELVEFLRLGREFDRPEHVCRLVDQVARQGDAADQRIDVVERLAGLRGGGGDDRYLDPAGAVILAIVGLLGLVAVEAVGAEMHAERHLGRLRAGQVQARRIEIDRGFRRFAYLGQNCAAEPGIGGLVERLRIADAHHGQTIGGRVRRRDHVHAGKCGALELGDLHGAGQHARRIDRGRRFAELGALSGENDRMTAGRPGRAGKGDVELGCHENSKGRSLWRIFGGDLVLLTVEGKPRTAKSTGAGRETGDLCRAARKGRKPSPSARDGNTSRPDRRPMNRP